MKKIVIFALLIYLLSSCVSATPLVVSHIDLPSKKENVKSSVHLSGSLDRVLVKTRIVNKKTGKETHFYIPIRLFN
jgi:hypothetical protein